MSDEIDISTGDAAFAYLESNGVPWHGLGTAMPDEPAPLEEWLKAAKLEWEAKTVPIYFGEQKDEMLEKKALVRSDTNGVLGIVTDRYVPVQPKEFMSLADTIREKFPVRIDTMGALFNGKRIFSLLNITDDQFSIDGDAVNRNILMCTSFDGSLRSMLYGTAIRVVCNNTLTAALKSGTVLLTQKHFAGIDPEHLLPKIENLLENDRSNWEQFKVDVELMMKAKLTRDKVKEYYVNVLYPDLDSEKKLPTRTSNIIDEVMDAYDNGIGQGTGDNVWKAYNGLTYYTDHSKQSKSASISISGAIFEDSTVAAIKRDAWNKAIVIANTVV
jgi:phage/plasmid-like protein (TIGR03299 family)